MCRIFGFRSTIRSRVHRSLVDADNALADQSAKHPDGWGVAYYIDSAPHVTRVPSAAFSDQIFRRVSGVASSETVLAHVRQATQGDNNVLNCHPFQFGRWTFVHNGDVPNWKEMRPDLTALVEADLRRFILGDTDSETIFFIFLTHLSKHGPLASRFELDVINDAMGETVGQVRDICDSAEKRSLLTFVLTDGELMFATHGGKELRWSTHKTRCSDRDHCPNLAPQCESPTRSGFVNHLVISSEVIKGENVWNEMQENETVAVNRMMNLHIGKIGRRTLPVTASC